MKRSNCLIFAIFVIILATAAGTSFAQSTDRDHPTPLNSSDISGSFGAQKEGNKEIFYSFMAGPGELTITLDVKARRRDDSGGVTFELLQGNGSSSGQLICCEGAQIGAGGTGRDVASVKLNRRQTVILHITNSFYNDDGGLFNFRISGATSFGSPSTGSGSGYGQGSGNGQGRENRGGEQISVPASGTLHIRMKNGSSKDIDLSLVRDISVRP